jgi:predicted Zn-dependent protease
MRHARLVMILAVAALGLSACASIKTLRVPLPGAPLEDPLVVSDQLEALIQDGKDTREARESAYKRVRGNPSDTAGAAFGRAAVTGRLVQQQGLLAANLVRDVEFYALRSRQLDPGFRDFAATRMLGTLYVLAPAALLKHGDSETGLEMLETLAREHPNVPENHLRLAEAYVSLGDNRAARSHLCQCLAVRDRLRRDDQQLLAQLFGQLTAGGKSLGCEPPR